jgi:hypothetical protein
MNLNQHFDKVVVLSQKTRIDRRFLWAEEAAKLGIKSVTFDAVEDPDPKRSFNLSHQAILQQFVNSKNKTVLVLEDDCTFVNTESANAVLKDMPDIEDWDILYFGANLKPHPEFEAPVRYSTHWYQVFNAYTTHAIAYTKPIANYILRNYSIDSMYDAWLDSKLQLFEAFCCSPFLAYQRPTRSDLWDRNVDYTDTFQASDNYLKTIQ